MRKVVVAVLLTLGVAACSDSQDPGLERTPEQRGPSNTLGECPADGPDATTPSAGCVDDSGQVVRP